MIQIVPYHSAFQNDVIDLILGIQQKEFHVPITLNEQPDLEEINSYYQVNRGNFWLATTAEGTLVGTIALIDNRDETATIRKMFVKHDFRGKDYNTANLLFTTLEQWAMEHGFASLWLGTFDRLAAAMRFYKKKGFSLIGKDQLPSNFPVMPVDNRFYYKILPSYFVRAATLSDIDQVLALQSQYLFAHLSEEERRQGFVTTPFTREQIARVIEAEQGLYIAFAGTRIVGYAFGASWNYWSQWPIFNYMVSRFPLLQWREKTFSVDNSYQYGPICLDLSMRGTGCAEALFGAVQANFRQRYALGLTFINQVNELSTAFHTRKLGLEIVDSFEFNGNKYFGLVFE